MHAGPYTVPDVAAYLGITEQSVLRYLGNGALRGSRGCKRGRWLITMLALEEFLGDRPAASPAPPLTLVGRRAR